ncbi:unnamed protein product [Polarella glacialis]|uniref:Uncharacterized protein n=1 Tax=Polarella glacialis TaxID=89957 RepID=A0A813H5Z3_POLGL|nr:unnamed protein product [Polarella glacialis]
MGLSLPHLRQPTLRSWTRDWRTSLCRTLKKNGQATGGHGGWTSHWASSDLPALRLRASVDRYKAVISDFSSQLQQRGIVMENCSEEELDYLLAEQVIDWFDKAEGAEGIAKGCTFVAAFIKVNPRHKYKTACRTLDVRRTKVPPIQAPAFAPEFAMGLACWLILAGHPDVAAVVVFCFTGLFRSSDMLRLTWEDFMFSAKELVFCLGIAKRGLEQKVVITSPSVFCWAFQLILYSKSQGEVWTRRGPFSSCRTASSLIGSPKE